MSIHKDNLPNASVWDVVGGGPVRVVTSQPGVMLISSVLDPQVALLRLRLTWVQVRREVVSAIHRHYLAHWATTFEVQDPRSAEQVAVRWLEPPSINWTNGITATVTAEFEKAIAHE